MKTYSHDVKTRAPTVTTGSCPKSFYDSVTLYQANRESTQITDMTKIMEKWVATAAPTPVKPSIPANELSEYVVPCDNQPQYARSRKSGAIVVGSYSRVKDSREYFATRMPVEKRSGQSFGASAFVSTCGGLYRPVANVVASEEGWEWATPPDPATITSLIEEAIEAWPTDLESNAWTAALAEANEAVYDLATDLAEFQQTVDFLRGALPSIRQSLAALRETAVRIKGPKRAFKRAKAFLKKNNNDIRKLRSIRHFKEVADYYLAYRYGVVPLMLSVRDAIEAVTSDRKIYVTARGNDSWEREGRSESGFFECIATTSVKGRGYVKTRWTKAGLRRVSMYVPTAVWEVVPYSFVVDWFVNVGDFIAALRPFDGEARAGTTSLTVERKIEIFRLREASSGSDPEPYPSGSWSRWSRDVRSSERALVYRQETKTYRRSVPRNFNPTLSTLSTPLSLLRKLDSVALGFQKLKIRKL